MALPQHYLMALLTPSGRLNQVGFAVLAIGLAFAHFWVYLQIRLHPGLDAWNLYTLLLFAMLWMKFCILSRRMHDTGSSGFFLVPILMLTALLYLCIIDPVSMGVEGLNSSTVQYFLEQGMRVPRALLIAAFVYCIRAAGETGPNGYGPEFGASADDREPRRGRGDRAMPLGQVPEHAFGAVARQSISGWGERKRPAGFGRR